MFDRLLAKYYQYKSYRYTCALKRLSPIGKIIYGHLYDSSLTWRHAKFESWVEDRKATTNIRYEYMLNAYPDVTTSPCILWIAGGEDFLSDSRVSDLTAHDCKILWPIIHKKRENVLADELSVYYALKADMIIRRLKQK